MHAGVPGCGKSTDIINRLNNHTIVLCQTRAPIDGMRSLLKD